MASNQGIGSFLPFPTFGGEKSGGITPVQMSPMSPNFPTPRAINRRTPEPEFVETIAPLLPFATEGLLGLIRDDDAPPTKEDRQEYIDENILYGDTSGAPLTAVQQAKLDAYDIYGEPDEGGADWGSILANLAVGSQMGRGAGDYATTALALSKAEKTKAAATETARANFLKDRTDVVEKDITMVDLATARVGDPQYRQAKTRTVGGKMTYWVHDPNGDFGKPDADGYVLAPKNFINPTQMGQNWMASNMSDPSLIALYKTIEDGMIKDGDTASFASINNRMLDLLQQDVNDPKVTFTTLTGRLMNIGNSALAEAGALIDLKGGSNFFGQAGSTTSITGRNGNGTASLNAYTELQQLMNLPQSPKTDKLIEQALLRLESTADIGELTLDQSGKLGESWIKDILGDSAYGNVRVRATFLQMAYMAAAMAGQTGRTLSDKDLAFFLEMVGYGASSDVALLHDNLLAFSDAQIMSNDARMQANLGLNTLGQYNLEDETRTGARNQIGMYYNVGKDNVTGEEDWGTLTTNNYKYKYFHDRYFDNKEIMEFFNRDPLTDRYQRPFTKKGKPTGTTSRGGVIYDPEFLRKLEEGP